jgi:hypothetical protein
VSSTEVEPVICGFHLWTVLGRANSLNLDREKIELDKELLDVLVLPVAFIYPSRRLTYFLDVSRIRSNFILDILLSSERSCHLGDIFWRPNFQYSLTNSKGHKI